MASENWFGNIKSSKDLGKSINYTHHLQLITEEMRQADPLIEEEVLNQRKQGQQIIQEEYKLFTYAKS